MEHNREPTDLLREIRAWSYVMKVKELFSDESETYQTFLHVVCSFKRGRDRSQILDEVTHLFRDHPGLIKEFTYFLPNRMHELNREANCKFYDVCVG